MGCAAGRGWDVNIGIGSGQHCSEVKLPKLRGSPREGKKQKCGKTRRGVVRGSMKLKYLWQILNYGERC